jgi:hypothetical protein
VPGHFVSRQMPVRALVLFALVSCGAASAARTPSDPQEAFTRQDQHWAKRINLRRADLPTGVKWVGYDTGGPGGSSGSGGDVGCPGARTDNSDLTETGRAASPLFIDTFRHYAIVSVIDIFKTSRQAANFVDRMTAAMRRCGPGVLKSQAGAKKGVKLLSFGPWPIPRAGRRWSNFRLVASIPVHGKRQKSFVDLGFGQRGRATAWFILHGTPAPIPADIEAGLIHVMAGRMAHPPR